MREKIIVFDSTLRDGEQSLPKSLGIEEKLEIAAALEEMNVDVIEAGFPASSPGDFASVAAVARRVRSSRVCALARCLDADIDAAAQALRSADRFRIHVFLSTSSVHMSTKLNKGLDEIVEMTQKGVKRARRYTDDVQFSCEDAGRTHTTDLCRVVETAIRCGASTVNIPDTVGCVLPDEFGRMVASLFARVDGIDRVVVSVHCHNDLGMAVANAVAAIQQGARQVEGTVNGLGERAGNTALEEIVMAIRTKKKMLRMYTAVKCRRIHRVSRLVSRLCGVPIAFNKAVVGENAFSHSSGIHQDGVLKNRKNYEILSPRSVGLTKSRFCLTARSGKAAVRHCMESMGHRTDQYDLQKLYRDFLSLADEKKQVFDYELETLAFVRDRPRALRHFVVDQYSVESSSIRRATAFVRLRCGSRYAEGFAVESDPTRALFDACRKTVGLAVTLVECRVDARRLRRGASSTRVDTVVKHNKRSFYGQDASDDAVRSFLNTVVQILNNVHCTLQIKKIA